MIDIIILCCSLLDKVNEIRSLKILYIDNKTVFKRLSCISLSVTSSKKTQ